MEKIFSMLKTLLKDKRGDAGFLLDTGFYKATLPKYEKIVGWLNKEKRLLDFMCLEITTAFTPLERIFCPGAVMRAMGRLDIKYNFREWRYNRKLERAIKKGQVSEIIKEIPLKNIKPEREFAYD